MSIRKTIAILGVVALLCGAVGACTTWRTEKTVSLPARPMVYPLAVKLMDVNWVNQELGRIPLLIEETRAGERITGVRVEPTGDIRLPGMADSAFRWKLLSCNATRINEPYTMVLKLEWRTYPGVLTHVLEESQRTTSVAVDMYGNAAWARVMVNRAVDGSFSMSIKDDTISGGESCSAEAFIPNPDYFQRDLKLKLVPMLD